MLKRALAAALMWINFKWLRAETTAADLDQCRPAWHEQTPDLIFEWRCGVIGDLELQRDVLDELEFEPSRVRH